MGTRKLKVEAVTQHRDSPQVTVTFSRQLTMLEVAGVKNTLDAMCAPVTMLPPRR